jgi:hypothetical protein
LAVAREQALLDYQAAETEAKALRRVAGGAKATGQQQEKATIAYDIIRREVETNRNIYEAMLERLKQTSVTAGMEFGGLRIVNPAFPSNRLDSPNVKWNLSLACLLGLALGVCFVLVRDFWSTSIRTIDEVEQLTALPVLGAVPTFRLLSATSLLPRVGTPRPGDKRLRASCRASHVRCMRPWRLPWDVFLPIPRRPRPFATSAPRFCFRGPGAHPAS